MSVDLATLAVEMDTSDVKAGVGDLDRLTASGAKAGGSMEQLGTDAAQAGAKVKTASAAAADFAAEAQRAAGQAVKGGAGIKGVGEAGKLASHQMQNLTFQLNDVFVGLTSGQKPMTVFMQQGSQIGQIMAQSGVGIGGMVTQVGALIGKFLMAHPVFLALGVAAGVVAGAFKLFQNEVEKSGELQKYADGLGLTKKEMEKLGPVGITAGDAIKGLWKTISDGLGLDKVFSSISSFAVDAFKWILDAGQKAVAGVYAGFVGTYRGITTVWSSLPGVMGEAVTGAANLVIAGFEWMVNKAIDGVNFLLSFINPILKAAGLASAGLAIDHVALGRITNSYAGAGKAAAGAFAAAYSGAYKEALGGMKALGNTLSDNIVGAAKDRMKSKADELIDDRTAKKAGGDAGKKAGKAFVDEFAKAVEKLNEQVAFGLAEAAAFMIKSKKEFAADYAFDTAHLFDEQRAASAAAGEAIQKSRENLAEFNDELARLKELAGVIDLGDIFGRGGDALESMVVTMKRLEDAQKSYNIAMFNASKLEPDKQDGARAQAEKAYQDARVHGTIAFLGATKSLFKEQSAGAKAVEIAQKGMMAVQVAKTAIDVAGGAAKMFSFLGPFAFPVVAAMMAVMAGLGFSGGGSSSAVAIPTAEDMQRSQGTGTVLGDSSAKSESIGNSLQLMLDNTNKELEFSNAQVGYLRSIDEGIGALTSALSRQLGLGANGAFSTTSLGLGSTGSSGILGALFGSTTTRTLVDQGVRIFTGVLAEVASGVSAAAYNVVQETTKKKLFGVTISSKTSATTTESELGLGIERQIGLVFANIRDSVIDATKTFGLDVTSYVNAISTEITISLQGLKGDEIGAAIEAVFSSFADKLAWQAGQVGLSLEEFQRAGEGMYETLMRVVKDFTSVQVALSTIGQSMTGLLDVAGNGFSNKIAGAENLVGLFGGLDSLISSVGAYQDKFLTEAEKMAPIIDAVGAEMARLGLASVVTKDQFKSVVQGLNLNTSAGQELFASLLTIAPAFAKVTDYLGSLDVALVDTAKTASQLADIAKQRRSLEIDLMTAMGDTAGALAAQRADQLASLDESNRALQQQVWATQEATAAEKVLADERAAAADQAAAVAKQRRSLEIDYMEATGRATEALMARRMDEIATLDTSLIGLQMNIWAMQDSTAAAEKLAQAQQDAAAAQTAAAEEAAARAKAIADERYGLEIRLMEATGDAAGALAAKRAKELAALDASNQALQSQIYAAEDAAAAAQALATAQAEAAQVAEQAAADAAQAAKAAADQAAAIAKEYRTLEIRLADALGDSVGSLAMRRADELAATNEANRAILAQVYAAEDAKVAADALAKAQADAAKIAEDAAAAETKAAQDLADAVARIAKERSSLEIRYLEAIGDKAAATAMRRAEEIAATDESNRALLAMIYAAEDASVAIGGVTDSLSVLREALNLQIRLLEAQGDASAATALKRQMEIDATAEANRALLLQVYAAEDAATAAKALADAQAAAAQAAADAQAEAARIAEDAAQKAAQIADQRAGLEIALLKATGQEAAALAAQRTLELAAIDASNQALQLQVWAAEDAATAAADLAAQQQAAADAAAAAAAAAKDLADATNDMTLRLLDAQGRTAEATAMRRSLEMAATDASLRGMLEQVYAAEDAATALEAFNQALTDATARVTDARGVLSDAYDREAGAIKQVHDRFAGFASTLREFRDSLGADAAFGNSYRNAQVAFIKTSALAATGDETGLSGLPASSRAFLEASKANAGSLTQYKRDVASVARALDSAIGAADAAVDYQSLQLAALDRSVSGLIEINASVVSVHDAIIALEDAMAGNAPPPPAPISFTATTPQAEAVVASNAELKAEIADLRAQMLPALVQIAQSTGDSARLARRWDRGNAMAITADSDQPVSVEVTA